MLKRNIILVTFLICFSIGLSIFLSVLLYNKIKPNPKYAKVVAEYNKNGETGDVFGEYYGQSKYYEVGINCVDKPVFKNPRKALKQFKKDYKTSIKTIKDEFNLGILIFDWRKYGTYGWQVTTDDKELKKKCLKVTSFFDIYENSFQE
jgi:hypothetical protein